MEDYDYSPLRFIVRNVDSGYHAVSYVDMTVPASWGNYVSGRNTWTWTLPAQDLIDGASRQSSSAHDIVEIQISLPNGFSGEVFTVDFQVSPEYYEEQETTSDPYTEYVNVTSYKPYLQRITPYTIHKVMMGLGGILIIIMGLIASPLPVMEWADGFLPINQHQGKRSRRRRRK